MMYKTIFWALSLSYTIMSPVINMIVPLKKEVVFVDDLTDKVNTKLQYPVLHFTGLVKQHGYIAEEHTVKTKDGYILTVHRISGSGENPPRAGKPVAFIQHGLLQASDSFVLIGPDSDLAFQLVNAGYDVWLGNARGNAYSRSHASKKTKNQDFWEFSQHEIGVYDLPASIDKALEVTGAKSLTFYGFSMGTTASYIMLSTHPEYNDKMDMVYSLAPVAFWKHALRRTMKEVKAVFNVVLEYLNYFKLFEVFPQRSLIAYFGERFCADKNTFLQPICAFITCRLFSMDFGRFNKTALPDILSHTFAGTSKMLMLHYLENYEKGEFQAYDYGKSANLKKYGQSTAPIYNLTNIRAPVSLWYAEAEDIVNADDVKLLAEKLPNVVSLNVVGHRKFNHIDFLWAVDAKQLVYDHIIKM